MASTALTAWNTYVDGLSVNNAQKTMLKTRGEQFYAQATKEAFLHIKKHINAALADGGDKTIGDFLKGVCDRVRDEDESVIIAFARTVDPRA